MHDNNPECLVSDDSRRNGRVSVDKHIQMLRQEKKTISQEKTKKQYEISNLRIQEKEEASKILSARLPYSVQIQKTMDVNSFYGRKRHEILQEIQSIEERIVDINKKLSNSHVDKKKKTLVQ